MIAMVWQIKEQLETVVFPVLQLTLGPDCHGMSIAV